MRRLAVLLAAALALAPSAAAARDPVRTSIFFYPWYGNPAWDGGYQHWQQRGVRPLASAFFPLRGLYSSSDRRVLAAQMREIAATGVDQVSVSWWGRGSPEDARLLAVLRAARAYGLDVAAHVEPYGGRVARLEHDIRYLAGLGITDMHVYAVDEAPPEAWRAANERVAGVRTFAQTGLVGLAARGGFDGFYTYDILVHGGQKFRRLCEQAHRQGLLCAPSVGPGYDARRAVGDLRVKPRRNGATYDAMWTAALRADADLVTITSYNEWHEGTQVEPARAHRTPSGARYAGYDGAYGARGKLAPFAYLRRTTYWTKRFDAMPR